MKSDIIVDVVIRMSFNEMALLKETLERVAEDAHATAEPEDLAIVRQFSDMLATTSSKLFVNHNAPGGEAAK